MTLSCTMKMFDGKMIFFLHSIVVVSVVKIFWHFQMVPRWEVPGRVWGMSHHIHSFLSTKKAGVRTLQCSVTLHTTSLLNWVTSWKRTAFSFYKEFNTLEKRCFPYFSGLSLFQDFSNVFGLKYIYSLYFPYILPISFSPYYIIISWILLLLYYI